ncbi:MULTISPECIES: peptidoglycan editing factor PgeF [unclassified Colwellia]|uniref:peptidoglycan editing factor PgeF n=1 Tax=unclassified Colwellia TaxID=196834 RepID=UPI0028705C56|nr:MULTISPECIES: peptidoglycan editing factor PgeF [unclassified Colwellia]
MTTNSPNNLQCIKWPTERVLAFATTRLIPSKDQLSKHSAHLLSNITNTEKFQAEFDAFNLGDHVGDCPNTVARNRSLLLDYLPATTKIQWLEQVHGNNVVVVEKHQDTPIVADAAITHSRYIALAIMTADCLPILLSNKDGSEIAAIHAGWRPLAANIIERTIRKMHSAGDEIFAWMGPCISPQAFEVGQEVKQAFCQMSEKFESAFEPVALLNDARTEVKFLANLQLIAELQLLALGVANITKVADCTYKHSGQYYSYRRDGKTGRMASVICIHSL